MSGNTPPIDPASAGIRPPGVAAPRPLGWGRFLLQFVSVILAYCLASAPPVLFFGMDSALGLGLSAVTSMAAGLFVAWLWLRSDRAVAEAWDLSLPASWPGTLGIAVASAIGIQLWFQLCAWLAHLAGLPAVEAGLVIKHVTESALNLVFWVVAVGWFVAGFGEELMWRGFLLDRLTRLPGIQGRAWLAVTLQATVFGLPHIYEGGASGIIVTGSIGLFFGWLRLRLRGNLWALVIAHALVDTASFLAAYVTTVYGQG
ncbi:CPBP family intramembrane glutamic endopeptidase [Novosphingobium album (ex Hu et al. 2023)]|uniref:CPBP family intramembrane metalloprotease n=1 Tax=Novosphingobium album (ex Hu et al. 2023) TaxID=2930093 RepID=A0ABT0B528_9SPHN|nr:CPBP family intramembrane glutamic endopeptidase [Novosphingobium album (ex Hu et al. 2023)]MCJ2179973.1 CPBP family intramembrane metalloprotease [Novosphingobium album (ex Hu et al. 2023)]